MIDGIGLQLASISYQHQLATVRQERAFAKAVICE